MVQICASVISEGGLQDLGIGRYISTDSNYVDATTIGYTYALIGVKLKSTHLDTSIKVEGVSVLSVTFNDKFEWMILFNPTVSGTFNYSDVVNSPIQRAKGTTANTVTGQIVIAGGYGSTVSNINVPISKIVGLGANIAGTPNSLILGVRPLTSNIDVYGGLEIRFLD